MINWKKVRNEYESTDITMKDLAKKHGVKTSTLRSRKRRGDWKKKSNTSHVHKNVATKHATQRKNDATLHAVDAVNDSGLNDRQQLFCMLYLRYYNATKAYKLAYDCNYSTATANGPRLLGNDRVQSTLKNLKSQQSNDLYLNANDILREYAKQAFADFGDYVEFGHKKDEDPDTHQPYERSYLYFKNKPDVDTSLISEAHIGQNGAVIKLNDKQKAMQELLKRLPEPTNTNKQDNSFVKALQSSLKNKNNKKKDNNDKSND